MSIIGSNVLAGASGGAGAADYQIERSLRFNSGDSAYLSRTPASAGNRKTWTISLWLKRCKLGSLQSFTSSNNNTILLFDTSDRLNFYFGGYVRTSTAVFRDVSAWYHIVLAVDTTSTTAQYRARIYVNGQEITAWDTNATITQNADTTWNNSVQHQINANNTIQFGDLYIADFHSIDGQALTPTDFGELDDNNIWQPKAFTGTYGTNGFRLDFSDNSSNAALGYDAAGSNDWTVNNLTAAGSAWNQSQTWSNSVSGTAYSASYPVTNAFDGNLSTRSLGDSAGLTFTPSSAITVNSSLRVYFGYSDSSATNVFKVNGTDYSSLITATGSNTGWVTVPGITSITSIFYGVTPSGSEDSSVSAIEVDGRLLVDSGILDSQAANIDSLVDTPTNYGDDTGAGGEVRGNYATLNPLIATSSTLSNGNLDYASTATYQSAYSTIGVRTGKWYFEGTVGTFASDALIGVGYAPFTTSTYVGGSSTSWGYEGAIGRIYNNTSFSAFGSTYGAGDVIGVAFDADTGKLWFAKNGTWQASGNPATGANPAVTLTTGIDYLFGVSAGNTGTWFCNWGARPFAYTAPSGYKALCTTNLPEPTIADGSAYMDVVTYAGDGNSTRTISGLSFSPDLVWLKNRTTGYSHLLYDVIRGAGSNKSLISNLASTEGVNDNSTYGYLSAFNSDGFSVVKGTDATSYTNGSSQSYVGWTWDAGANSSKTYAVTVVSDSGNKYRFDGFGTSAVTLDLEEGSTYTFDQSDSSNSGHPLRFSTTSNGTHGGGSEYTTGVVTNGTPGSAGAYTRITVAAGAPTLYYYCSVHSGMGGQANTNSTAGASNFDGGIQSTVRVNAEAGFSVVTYTAGTAGSTVGHGLGATPELIIVKSITTGGVWVVYHASLGSSSYLILNSTAGTGTSSNYWGSPSSTTFGISSSGFANNSGDLVAYCFSAVSSYSSFGSYIGNGSADGPACVYRV